MDEDEIRKWDCSLGWTDGKINFNEVEAKQEPVKVGTATTWNAEACNHTENCVFYSCLILWEKPNVQLITICSSEFSWQDDTSRSYLWDSKLVWNLWCFSSPRVLLNFSSGALQTDALRFIKLVSQLFFPYCIWKMQFGHMLSIWGYWCNNLDTWLI